MWQARSQLLKKMIITVMSALWFGAAPAWAVLGESIDSVRSDHQRLQGQLVETARQGYSLHQITAPDGAIVKEYVSPKGKVFGVSWQARTMPDLRQLLGSYFAEFQQQASQSSQRRHGPLMVRTEHLVVESGGHMRAFRGRAFVPSLMPDAVTPGVVR